MDLKFDENGLIPAIVQDHYTKEVLTLAYMNAESLAITIDEGRTCFWSRSRQELWRKGARLPAMCSAWSPSPRTAMATHWWWKWSKPVPPATPARRAAFSSRSTCLRS